MKMSGACRRDKQTLVRLSHHSSILARTPSVRCLFFRLVISSSISVTLEYQLPNTLRTAASAFQQCEKGGAAYALTSQKPHSLDSGGMSLGVPLGLASLLPLAWAPFYSHGRAGSV